MKIKWLKWKSSVQDKQLGRNSQRMSEPRGKSKEVMYNGSESKEFACNAGDLGLIPGSGRSPGGGHGNLSGILAWRILDRGAWWVTVHAAAKSQTRLSNEHFYFWGKSSINSQNLEVNRTIWWTEYPRGRCHRVKSCHLHLITFVAKTWVQTPVGEPENQLKQAGKR